MHFYMHPCRINRHRDSLLLLLVYYCYGSLWTDLAEIFLGIL